MSLRCFLLGHVPSIRRGVDNSPVIGAYCRRCRSIYTRSGWQ